MGKTVDISTDILHFLFTTKGQIGLVTAPMTSHLREIIEEIEFQFDNNEILKSSLHPERGIRRQPYYRLEFAGGSVVHFMPAGNDGQAYKSKHVHRIWVDEAAKVGEQAWRVLYQRLLEGGRLDVHCYPDGRRNTEYCLITQGEVIESNPIDISQKAGGHLTKAGAFLLDTGWKVFLWPMMVRPDWTADRLKEKITQHHGMESPSFQHMVLGQHGKPAYGAFDMESFFACQKIIPGYKLIDLTADSFSGPTGEDAINERIRLILDPFKEPDRTAKYWIGCDTGYTNDPAVYTIWQEHHGHRRRIIRFHLRNVMYPIQGKFVAELDRRFRFKGIGIDNGANGSSIIHDFRLRDEFADLRDRDLDERLLPVDFGGTTVIAIDDDDKEIKERTKKFMTDLINGAMQRREVTYPKQDEETEEEYGSQTYTLSESNRVVYSKGNDHIIDADRTAFLVREWVLRLSELDGYTEEECIGATTARGFW